MANGERRMVVGLLGLLLAACGGAKGTGVVARGTVEVREVDIAPLAPGRVVRLLVDEGSRVTAGDTLVILTAPTLDADLEAARARVASAEAVLRDLQAGSRPQEIAAARAQLASARADAARLEKDRQRLVSLRDAGAIAPREYDAAAAAATVASEQVRTLEERLSLLQAGSRPQQIAAARAEVANARAALAGRQATSDEFVLTAPVGGMIVSRLAETGDLVAAGRPALVLGEVARPWVRIYLPARELPGVMVGDPAVIYAPGVAIDASKPAADSATGSVMSINPRAEYVTRVALTEEERADLLFGVRVAIDDPGGRFKMGMPVTVRLTSGRDST